MSLCWWALSCLDTLQAISNEENSANSRGEKLREKASNNLLFLFLHPNNSNARNAKSSRVYSFGRSEACFGTETKELQGI